jgi:AcrR family transcriptional regulator
MDGARMQDIANRAGINKALLHYYFRTKDMLFDAVFQKLAGMMFDKFAPVLKEDMSLEEKIRYFFREHISFLQKNPKLPGFIINEINRNPGRIKKIISHIDIGRYWKMLEDQHREELVEYNLTRESIPQIMTTIASMSVFPFAARAILESLMEKQGIDYNTYLEQRKEFAADFVIAAIKNLKNKSK